MLSPLKVYIRLTLVLTILLVVSACENAAPVPDELEPEANDQLTQAIETVLNHPEIEEADILLRPNLSRGENVNGFYSLFSIDEQNKGVVAAVLNSSSEIVELYRSYADEERIFIEDLVSNRKSEIGKVETFFGADGTTTDEQRDDLISEVAVFISAGFFSEDLAATRVGDDIEVQGIATAFCKWRLDPPPTDCGSGSCNAQADNYRNSVCNYSLVTVDILTIVFYPPSKGVEAAMVLLETGFDVPEFVLPWDAWKKYRDCIDEDLDCEVIMQVLPPEVTLYKKVGMSGTTTLRVKNSPTSDTVLYVTAGYFADGPLLPSGVSFRPHSILPGGSVQFGISWKCEKPGTFTGTYFFEHNADVTNSSTFKATLECVGEGPRRPVLLSYATTDANGHYSVDTNGDGNRDKCAWFVTAGLRSRNVEYFELARFDTELYSFVGTGWNKRCPEAALEERTNYLVGVHTGLLDTAISHYEENYLEPNQQIVNPYIKNVPGSERPHSYWGYIETE